jgi:hypothetical protein
MPPMTIFSGSFSGKKKGGEHDEARENETGHVVDVRNNLDMSA